MYNPETGKPKSESEDAKLKSHNYTRLVWKQKADGTKLKVGFGVQGSWVVAWMCGIPSDPTAEVTKENVPNISCMKDYPETGTATGKYDGCFNDLMLKVLNLKRRNHIVDPLKLKTEKAADLYKAVADSAEQNKWDVVET